MFCAPSVRGTAWFAIIGAAVALLVAAPAGIANSKANASRSCAYAHIPATHVPARQLRAAVVCLVNRERARRGLPALRELRRLDRAAQGHSDDMVARGYVSHSGLGERVNRAGYRWSALGENIASGQSTAAAVVRAWMSSTGHCRNILDPGFRHIGVGVSAHPVRGFARRPATWTEDFGRPAGAAAASGRYGPADGCPY
jgi:uncharacterized protein YkwD